MGDFVITGATGFVGGSLIRALIAREVSPVALVRRESAAAELERAYPGRVRARVAALDDPRSIRAALRDVEPRVVFHLAGGRAPAGDEAARANLEANVTPTIAVLAALDGTSSLLLLASTGEVYGKRPGPFVESMAPQPLTAYASAKVAAEAVLTNACGGHAPDFVIARLSVVYGPGPWHGAAAGMLVPRLIVASRSGESFKMTSGEQTRDFLFVDDAARALLLLAETPQARGLIVNVGVGESHAVGDVARRVLDAVGASTMLELGARPHHPNDILDYRLDISRLRELTGFSAEVDLDEGIRRAAALAR